jgi:hypothetical protein
MKGFLMAQKILINIAVLPIPFLCFAMALFGDTYSHVILPLLMASIWGFITFMMGGACSALSRGEPVFEDDSPTVSSGPVAFVVTETKIPERFQEAIAEAIRKAKNES